MLCLFFSLNAKRVGKIEKRQRDQINLPTNVLLWSNLKETFFHDLQSNQCGDHS